MDKGYYRNKAIADKVSFRVAIHNKNGQGLLQTIASATEEVAEKVAIHNKNGQGLLLKLRLKQSKKTIRRRNPQ